MEFQSPGSFIGKIEKAQRLVKLAMADVQYHANWRCLWCEQEDGYLSSRDSVSTNLAVAFSRDRKDDLRLWSRRRLRFRLWRQNVCRRHQPRLEPHDSLRRAYRRRGVSW